MNFSESFKQFESALTAGEKASWLYPVRLQAIKEFERLGLPTRKNEEWKYTSVKTLQEIPFSLPTAITVSQKTKESVQKICRQEFTNLVFVNGVYQTALSDSLPAALKLTKIEDSQDGSRIPKFADDAFVALNTAFAKNGYVLTVAAGQVVEKPVHILSYVDLQGGPALAVHPRLTILVESRSKAAFIEGYYGETGTRYFNNSLTEIFVAESASVEYARSQTESLLAVNIGKTQVYLEKNAQADLFAFSSGAQLARHNMDVLVQGEGASAKVNGLYIVKGQQHVDNHTTIDFIKGQASSSQLYKGILDEESRAVFNGKVVIRQDSQKADSQQLNKNLLLSRAAEIDSKPELEIYADDVKATHGSTVGQIDANEVFYLQSRAIPKAKALEMLSLGFADDVIYQVGNPTMQKWFFELAETALWA